MAVPRRLLHALQRSFGREATEDMVTWIQEVQSLRADVSDVRTEMREVRHEMKEFRLEMRAEFAEFRAEMRGQIGDLRVQIASVQANLMKWSFAFWIGAVIAIAALAGVLRWTS